MFCEESIVSMSANDGDETTPLVLAVVEVRWERTVTADRSKRPNRRERTL